MLFKYTNFNQTYILKKNQVIIFTTLFFRYNKNQRKSLAVVVLEGDEVLVK